MQKHSLIIIFPILCLTAFACSLFRPAETRFENEEISFDYPEGWKPLEYFWSTHELVYDKNFDAQEIAGIADSQSQSFQLKYSRSCKVMLKDLPPGESLQIIVGNTYPGMTPEVVDISESETTFAGLPAYEKIYKQPWGEPWYQVRDLWVEVDGEAYILSCKTYPQDFESARVDFEGVSASFRIK